MQHGYPAALFTPFSHYIAESKAGYYRAYEQIESNALITGYTDVTPFLAYFCENVYGRLQFGTDASHADMQIYKDALEAGTVTEKERQLWEYVLKRVIISKLRCAGISWDITPFPIKTAFRMARLYYPPQK